MNGFQQRVDPTAHTDWERVNDTTLRLRVPGGWLYQVQERNSHMHHSKQLLGWHAPILVPDGAS